MNYKCDQCSKTYNQWAGQCSHCLAWNSLSENTPEIKKDKRSFHYHSENQSQVVNITDITLNAEKRVSTQSKELDRVLGGGLVNGSVILIGGDPGIGKSTLLIQTLANLSQHTNTLYVTGEESLQQVAMRANRLQLQCEALKLFAETQVEKIVASANKHQPTVMVIDSIQTIFTDNLNATPGGVSQVKESAQQLVRFAKANQITLFIVGHVTKEGALAGPRVLEHMVDTVLYFEGERDNRFRMIRAIKNRFGAVNELGLFAMTDKGLKDVSNPSAIFLSKQENTLPGSVIMVTCEGTRPILVEVQALVDNAYGPPKRVAVGLDNTRVAMLLAVLNRHGRVNTAEHDIFINIVGGVKVTETSIDLAIVIAILSSLQNQPIASDIIVFGEVGLAGEIRPVPNGQQRLQEAIQHGMKKAIIPKANQPRKELPIAVEAISDIQTLVTLVSNGQLAPKETTPH